MAFVVSSTTARVAAFAFLTATALAAPVAPKKQIVVTEGTDMQVTVSPDRRTILADIQG